MIQYIYLAESFAEKTGIHWPYMVLFIIGACLASIVLVCCSCYRIRKAMNYKRKAEENFESKFYPMKINKLNINHVNLDLTYRNQSSHHSYHNANGNDSLGNYSH